ncbi:CheR family methyltransferase [Alkalitalea saponilacus]|uniref:protein-glutamate O-methyltransferase n=1 Tax=Alkalitalea saponilacus TaxID=889453 RepID=A0A1T5ECV3_9BACT|nr:CheR family methyltransferase [Alkalitalea saponilacus]ASB49032.1 chemotaxis protein CheR [Alkalitalea saponilacus]SKB81706.1 chemotaxis protein methyltransferase CheR [Alkalitalea saponilacus]
MTSINQNPNGLDCFKAELSEKDFQVFSQYIYSEYGIKMPPIKRIMLQGRLLKRIRELKMNSYSEYKEYFFSKDGQQKELLHFLNVVTTNKTDFFREPVHFIFLNETVLQDFSKNNPTHQPLKIWSAGCSSGEEPYTISIVLNEYQRLNPSFKFEIQGTDISTQMLEKAARGIYPASKALTIPMDIKKKYFLKSKDVNNQTIRVHPHLQKNIKLGYLNLMDTSYGAQDMFDVIFCRNVLIYFDRPTQEKVINKLCTHLKKDGHFFIGHSESLSGMDVPLKHIKPTIFKKI